MSSLKPSISQAKATFEKIKPTLAVVKKPELALQLLSEAVVDFVSLLDHALFPIGLIGFLF